MSTDLSPTSSSSSAYCPAIDVDEVIMGNVLSAGLGQAPARQASIMSGLPVNVRCTSINKVCSSGLKAIALAAQSIALGDAEVVVAGGMESMSNVPFYLSGQSRSATGLSYGNQSLLDGILKDGLTCAINDCHMAVCTELSIVQGSRAATDGATGASQTAVQTAESRTGATVESSHSIASHSIASHSIASHSIASHSIAPHSIASHSTCSPSSLPISRQEQDSYAAESYKRALSTDWSSEIIPIRSKTKEDLLSNQKTNNSIAKYITSTDTSQSILVDRDEELSKVNIEKIPKVRAAFSTELAEKTSHKSTQTASIPHSESVEATITAANASKLGDGAAALVLASQETVITQRLIPQARIMGWADAEVEPIAFGTAPVLAIQKVLKKTGIRMAQISVIEVNEAFAAVVEYVIREAGLPRQLVNQSGGAIALGHPLGASGARLVVTALRLLKPGQLGLVAICNGGGGASAMLIEKLS